jgi:hypothetical protein
MCMFYFHLYDLLLELTELHYLLGSCINTIKKIATTKILKTTYATTNAIIEYKMIRIIGFETTTTFNNMNDNIMITNI